MQWSSIFSGTVSFKEALAVIHFFIGIELIQKSNCNHPFDELPFFYYKRVIAATHSFKFTVFLQNRNFRKGILTIIGSFVSGMHISKKVCYMTASFTAIRFFYDSVIISRQHLKRFTCQGNCLYFTILFATIPDNKRSAVDSRNSWRVCLFEKNHLSPAVLKVPIYSTVQVAILFVWKVTLRSVFILDPLAFRGGKESKYNERTLFWSSVQRFLTFERRIRVWSELF